jgi:hypothetical protein
LNYKETLYFIAKCLTISLSEQNREEIELILEKTDLDWDSIVKISTAHYVFPALYCNFQRANFLHYLPKELVAYMEYITILNRERNEEIITQARELNTLLLANNITPLFLKGTGNILAELYEDIAERMVGDIDFILSKEDYPKAIKILREFGYSEVEKLKNYSLYYFRHYRRLQKKDNIAAIEIHSELISIIKFTNEFNYNFVEKDSQVIKGATVLSYANKLNLSIIANQINDNGFEYKTMALRNAYDVLLLSKKTNAKEAVNTLDKLSNPLNCFLAACYEVFNKLNSLEYENSKKTVSYLNFFNSQFTNPIQIRRNSSNIVRRILIFFYRFMKIKEYRVWLLKKLLDKNWRKLKLIQLGFKK